MNRHRVCAGAVALIATLAVFASNGSVFAQSVDQARQAAPQRVVWRKVPIKLRLRVGSERIIHFPKEVAVGLPVSLQSQLRSISVNGSVYWLARAPFARTRVFVREVETGRIYLFDLEASTTVKDTTQVYVHVADDSNPNREAATRRSQARGAPAHDYISLTRLAAKKLYAPARLAGDLPGIHRRPVNVKTAVKGLYRGAKLEARPLASWSADGLYVTAVYLRNRTPKSVLFDPRDLRGAWLAATAQHARLLPAGERGDTTTLYLISDRPFADALPFLPTQKEATKSKTGKSKRGAGSSAGERL